MFMNAKYSYGLVFLFLAVRTLYCIHRNMLNMAQKKDPVLVLRMPSIFVHTSTSRSMFVECVPRFSYKVMHFGTQLYFDRQV
jgi:hypothetical protein